LITEREAAMALPSQGWLREYVEHAIRQTTAPLGYHLGVGLSVLAVTCPLNFGSRYAGTLRGNLYTLLVGRSGEDQKSTALDIGRRVLFTAAPTLIGDHPGSWEGLVDSLSRRPAQVIVYSEFGKFLSAAQKGYFEPLKATMTDLWDCTPQHRVKANGVATRVDDPRLSIMAGCSIPYLERHTEPHDWSGGFMGRWLVLYSRRERVDPDPVGDDSAVPALAANLTARASVPAVGDYAGLDAGARVMWDDWFYDLERRPVPDIIAGAKTRAPTLARKISMLLAWDYGQALSGSPWQITVDELEPAIRIAELHLKSVIGLSDKLAEHPEAQTRRSVLEAVPLGGAATLGQILRATKMRRRNVTEILDALVLDGSLTRANLLGGDALYERPVR
jgi:hypothetical protein